MGLCDLCFGLGGKGHWDMYRRILKKLKDRVREGEFNLNTKEMRKIMKVF